MVDIGCGFKIKKTLFPIIKTKSKFENREFFFFFVVVKIENISPLL